MWLKTFCLRCIQLIWDRHSLEAVMGGSNGGRDAEQPLVRWERLTEEGRGKLGLFAPSASSCELGGFQIIRFIIPPSPKIVFFSKLGNCRNYRIESHF